MSQLDIRDSREQPMLQNLRMEKHDVKTAAWYSEYYEPMRGTLVGF